MITITRMLARRLRSVFRHALNLTPSMFGQPIHFTSGPDGLRAFASLHGFAACYQEHFALPACQLTIPLSLLREVEATQAEPVYLLPAADGGVIARWQDGVVPQERIVAVPADKSEVVLPALPDEWTENPPELRQALADAAQFVDPSSARYALGCIQLRGTHGDLNATDGRQIFRQSGFQFGTELELLIRPSGAFGAKEFAIEQPVQFGNTDNHAVIGLGAWQFWLPLEKDARFPRIDDVIPPEIRATTTLQLSRADTTFLAENLKRLPISEDVDQPVTLDLNGCVAIRGRAADTGAVTELRLSNSERVGGEVCINTNRRFLDRAAKFGFERLSIVAPESPIVCRDGHRTYVWAVLNAKEAIPAGNSVVIESPVEKPRSNRRLNHPNLSRSTTSMATRPIVEPPAAVARPANQTSAKEPSVTDQAIALRGALRDTLTQVANLVRAIKRQKKQERFLRTTLASLKQLQNVA